MVSHNGLGRELLWGLLACHNDFVSREALAGAVQAWLAAEAIPLGQVLRDHLGLDPERIARVDALTRDYVQARDSRPHQVLQTAPLRDVLEGLLAQVSDPRARSNLEDAALSVGIEAHAPDSLTIGDSPGDLTRLIEARMATGHRALDGPGSRCDEDPKPTTIENADDPPTTMSSTEPDPAGSASPPHDPAAYRARADDQTEEFRPALPSARDQGDGRPRTDSEPVAPIRYRIIRPHAEGGLGAVFVAHDEELHREVALKEILERHSHITENRLRFLLEAEVTGGLEHPGIVPVHGMGQYEDGRPYYAMRFIRGNSLKSAIALFHAADGTDRDPSERALALRRLLTHFVDVCEAIAYAHSRGVLHRDLKPANIMLGKFGETLVVDWGLAKPLLRCFPQNDEPAPAILRTVLDPAEERTLPIPGDDVGKPAASDSPSGGNDMLQERPLIPPSLGKSSETVAGTRVGTPAFMSPEQAAGHVDRLGPASDIYSLGATLYNLLTGKLPFTGSDLSRTLARVVEGDFPSPRQVNHSVPRPLEAIVLKAMALKPEDRYASPKLLRNDIEHWMADEAVSAYRDPLGARLARWARRHKTAVASSTALLLAAVVGLSIGSVLLERERARTDLERALRVKNYGFAYEAAETIIKAGDVDLADVPQMESVRLGLLETARLQFDKLLEQESNDPEILVQEGRTRARLGDVLEMMGQYAESEQNYLGAINSLQALEQRLPGDDRPLRARARAEHGLGVLLRTLNRFREAETWLRETVLLREQLAARSPEDREVGQALSDSRYHLGALLARLASPDAEDRKLYNQAIKDQEARLNLNPDEPENRLRLARYWNNLAILESRTDPAKAERSFRQVLNLLAGLDPARASLPGARWQAARASNNLATLIARQGRHDEAETKLKQARDSLDRLTAEFPRIDQYRRELASIFRNLGLVARDTKRKALAVEAFSQAASRLKELARKNPQVPDYQEDRDIALFQLGLLKAQSDLAAGELDLNLLLADQEKLIATHPTVPDYRNALGGNLLAYAKLLHDHGDSSRALPLVERAVARIQDALEEDPGNRTYGQNLSGALTLQILIAVKGKQTEQVAALAERLIQAPTADLRSYLTAAMGLTRCLVMTSTNDALTPEVREPRADGYARRAVEILRKAMDRGLLHSPDPLKDEEFLPLRTRPDFIDLFKALRDRQAPATG